MKNKLIDSFAKIPADIFSNTIVLSKKSRVESSSELLESYIDLGEFLRSLPHPDKGICIDARGVVDLNEAYKKALIGFVKDTLKKNIIGLDLRVDRNPCKDVKDLIAETKKLLEKSESSSVRCSSGDIFGNS